MRVTFFILVFCTSTLLFSQNKEMSYYFDRCTEYDIKIYNKNLHKKVIHFKNTRDSTYSMSIVRNKDSVYASLYDHKNSFFVNFNVGFQYNAVEDLQKFNNIRLIKYVTFHEGNKNKNFVEEFEYEKDTIQDQTLVHITHFKNKKKKKILNEHYYYFSNNDNIINSDKNNIKDYLLNKYNLFEIKNQNLEKTIWVVNEKKQSESVLLSIKNIDYTFSFTPDKIFPTTNYPSITRTIINTTQ